MDTKRLGSQTIRESVYSGAVHGIMVWSVYAVVECFFSSILSWIVRPSGYNWYIPLHLGFTALLFILYPVIGLILGGLFGLGLWVAARRIPFLQKVQPAIFFPVLATLMVVLAYAINIVVNHSSSVSTPLGLSEFPPLSICVLLIFGLALSTKSKIWYNRLRFLTNPWAVSLVLLGLPWINDRLLGNSSLTSKAGAALVYPAVIYLISFFVQQLVQTRQPGKSKVALSAYPIKYLVFMVFAVLVLLGMNFFLHQKPLVVESNSISSHLSSDLPNILLVIMDTVRADHLSLYGYERDTTPNLKKLSEEATLYTHAIASSDLTLSTHASIFTAMDARQHGAHTDYHRAVMGWGRPLANKFHTLAEILSEKGYSTLGVVANHGYLGPSFGLHQGFHYYDVRAPVPLLAPTKLYYLRQSIRNILTHFAPPSSFDMLFRRAEDINREVFNLLDKLKKDDERFFLFINYMDAHWPYIPPHPFDSIYPGKKGKKVTTAYRTVVAEEILKLERQVTEEDHNHFISQFDGGIAYIDFHLGELIRRLKKLGLYENSLIIITSDHGEAFGERNFIDHGVSVYQDQVHVPLIIKYPNNKKKIIVDKIVSVIDILPTILDILGYEMPEDIAGESLLKIESGRERLVISESFPNSSLLNDHPRFHRVERAIYSWPFKFINSTSGKKELYDLSKDPNEERNLYQTNEGVSRELETRLNQWLDMVVEESGSPAHLDEEALDRLKSLGYIQ